MRVCEAVAVTGNVVRLDNDQLEMLADLIADRLRPSNIAAGGLVDAATLAAHLAIGRETVYEHAEILGARRLGLGPRPRLRFDLEEAERRWTSCLSSRKSEAMQSRSVEPVRRRRRRAGLGTDVNLLPIRGGQRG
jgi:hypothetical protein